ncbi:MAG: hypothetical protein QOC54_2980 [Baekduia sp.]|jgi:hypothetical protein|nr:hypothetical protein [Baekduia sp.]
MLIAGVIALCIVLLILAFLAPRLSRHPQRGANKAFGLGARGGSKAPGKLGKWFSKPFRTSQKAVNRSAQAGRRGRGKMPL